MWGEPLRAYRNSLNEDWLDLWKGTQSVQIFVSQVSTRLRASTVEEALNIEVDRRVHLVYARQPVLSCHPST